MRRTNDVTLKRAQALEKGNFIFITLTVTGYQAEDAFQRYEPAVLQKGVFRS